MKSSLAAGWSSPAPLSFPFYSVIPPCLFVCFCSHASVCLPFWASYPGSFPCLSRTFLVSHLRCSSSPGVPFTTHSSTPALCSPYRGFYFVLLFQQSVLPCLVLYCFLCVSFTSQLPVYSGVFFLCTFYAFIHFFLFYFPGILSLVSE